MRVFPLQAPIAVGQKVAVAITGLNPAGRRQQFALDPLGQWTRTVIIAVVVTFVTKLVTVVGPMLVTVMFMAVMFGLGAIMVRGSWLMIVIIVPARNIVVSVFVLGDRTADNGNRGDATEDFEQIVICGAGRCRCQAGYGNSGRQDNSYEFTIHHGLSSRTFRFGVPRGVGENE